MSEEITVPVAEEIAAPAQAEQETEASATSTANEGDNEQTGEQKHKGGFQRRIDKLTKEKSDKERELAYWREQALRTQPTETKKDEPVKSAETAKPKSDDFATWDEYHEALTDWKVEQKLSARDKEATEKAEKAKAEAEQKTASQKWEDACEKAREAHEDFDEVALNPDIQQHITPVIAAAVAESDVNTEIAYYLGQHPDELQRISKLSPVGQAREIGKLEAQFASGKSEASATEVKEPPISKAPAPIKPVGKASGHAPVDIHDPAMPYKDFVKAREAQLKRK